MNYKRIVLSLGMIVFVGAVVISGTGAFFSDTETSTGNTFTAGSIDLSLGSQYSSTNNGSGSEPFQSNNNGRALFNFNDLKPGDTGSVGFNLEVTSNEAYVCAMSEITSTPENGRIDPEVDAGDTTGGANGGELQNYLQFATFDDENENGVHDPGEPLNVNQFGSGDGNGFTAAELAAAGWVSVADNNSPSTWLVQPTLGANDPESAGMLYCFGDFDSSGNCSADLNTDYNDAQTDQVVGSIEFYAVQTRNNDGFTCDQLNATSTPSGEVGSNFALYNAPATGSCDVTVSSGQSIQTNGIDAASSGQTVCVDDGTYTGPIDVNKPLTLASLNGPSAVTIDGGVKITSSDVTVQGFTVESGVVPGDPSPLGFYVAGGSNITVDSNDIDGMSTALSRGVLFVTGATYSNVTVTNNDIHDHQTGIYTNPHTGNVGITYNDIFDNTAGIGGYTGATVNNNEFSGTAGDEAIGADSTYDNSSVMTNNFLDDVEINTYGTVSPSVDAENNFFSTSCAAQGDAQVDCDPETATQYTHR